MKKYLLILLLFFSAPAATVAYELPYEAQEQLEEILSDKKFHPRGNSQSKFKKRFNEIVDDFLTRLREILDSDAAPNDNSEMSGFWGNMIENLAAFSEWFLGLLANLMEIILYLSAFALITLVLHRIYQTLNQKNDSENQEYKSPSFFSLKTKKTFPYLKLVKNGDYKEALLSFHAKLRDELVNKNDLPTSLTDREVLNRLKDENFIKTIFSRLTLIFEKTIYAQKEAKPQTIQKLISDYEAGK